MDDPRMQSLVERILGSSAPVLVSAVGGSGKRQLVRSVARATGVQPANLGKSGWTIAVETDSPALLLEANADATDPALDTELAAALDARYVEGSCIVVARRFGPQVLTAAHRDQLLHLTEHDLWYDRSQLTTVIGQLGGDQAACDLVFDMTDGWPALVADLLARKPAFDDSDATMGSLLRDVLDVRMNEALQHLPDECVRALAGLGAFEVFDNALLEMLDIATATRLVHAGMPVTTAGRGLHSLPQVVRSWLMLSVPRPTAIPSRAFAHLSDQGFAAEAIEAAIACRQLDDAACVLASLSADQTDRIDVDRIVAASNSIGEQKSMYPRSHLVEARVQFGRGDLSSAMQTVQDGLARLDQTAHPETAEEMRAELSLLHYQVGDLGRARNLLPSPERFQLDVARARQLDIEAGIAALGMTSRGLTDAALLYNEAIDLWRESACFSIAATSSARLAVEVLFQQGHFDEAIGMLRHAETVSSAQPIRTTNLKLHRALIEATAGYRTAARETLDRCSGAITSIGIAWLRGCQRNVELVLAGQDLSLQRVLELEQEMRVAFGERMHIGAGTIALSETIEAYIRCDSIDNAQRCLSELLANPNAEPPMQRFAQLQVACHFGDPSAGLQACDNYESSGLQVPNGSWRLEVARAFALGRLGQPSHATQALDRAKAVCTQLGVAGLVDRVERRASAITTHAAKTTPASSSRPCGVQILSEFSVTFAGEPVVIAEGQQQSLLKLLVVNRGTAPLEVVIEALWPDVDPTKGRSRIRNVIARLRKSCGPIIERDGEMLRLAENQVWSDYLDWSRSAQAQLRATRPGVHELEQLISSAPNELLPADRYAEWIQEHQRSYQTVLLRLIDRRIDRALESNDTGRALALYHRALDIDPADQNRLELAVSLALSAGLADDAATFERRGHNR